jgi:hypothetical protein
MILLFSVFCFLPFAFFVFFVFFVVQSLALAQARALAPRAPFRQQPAWPQGPITPGSGSCHARASRTSLCMKRQFPYLKIDDILLIGRHTPFAS